MNNIANISISLSLSFAARLGRQQRTLTSRFSALIFTKAHNTRSLAVAVAARKPSDNESKKKKPGVYNI
jgi:hypothetical protein